MMVSPVVTVIDCGAGRVPVKAECDLSVGAAHLPEDVARIGAINEKDIAGRVCNERGTHLEDENRG